MPPPRPRPRPRSVGHIGRATFVSPIDERGREDVTVADPDLIAERFEDHRAQLGAVAYRMLGSPSEAEDAVQEAWLRLSRSDAAAVDNLGGWLTTVVGRVCLDMLRARRARREDYVGTWLPEPVAVREDDGADPAEQALLADSVGLALLVVLDALTPAERLAFVLHDMSPCRSTRSGPSSDAHRRRRASSRAARGAGCAAALRRRTWTSRSSAGRSPPSSRRRAPETSRRCSRCSTPRSSSASTRARGPSGPGRRSSAPPRSRARCWRVASASRRSGARRSSTERPASSWARRNGRLPSSA